MILAKMRASAAFELRSVAGGSFLIESELAKLEIEKRVLNLGSSLMRIFVYSVTIENPKFWGE